MKMAITKINVFMQSYVIVLSVQQNLQHFRIGLQFFCQNTLLNEAIVGAQLSNILLSCM